MAASSGRRTGTSVRCEQPIARSAYRLDQRLETRSIEFAPQVTDVDVDDVAPGVEAVFPYLIENPRPAEDMGRIAHEELEQCPFPGGELDPLAGAPGDLRQEVEPQVKDDELRRGRLRRCSQRGPDACEQLLEHEGLGDVVVG